MYFVGFFKEYNYTRDNPGDALVLKQKYNPEKWQYWNFSTGAKIVGNNSKFYFSPLETSG